MPRMALPATPIMARLVDIALLPIPVPIAHLTGMAVIAATLLALAIRIVGVLVATAGAGAVIPIVGVEDIPGGE
jgi:hypothetical protein